MRKKYEMCKNFKEKGVCKYYEKCLFAHGEHELSKRQPIETLTSTVLEEIKNDKQAIVTPKKVKEDTTII